jgi:hypothetical protein
MCDALVDMQLGKERRVDPEMTVLAIRFDAGNAAGSFNDSGKHAQMSVFSATIFYFK